MDPEKEVEVHRIMTRLSALAEGDVLLSRDGRFIVLQIRLTSDTWGCDMLEDEDGIPSPTGNPACYALKVSSTDLAKLPMIIFPENDDREGHEEVVSSRRHAAKR